MTTESMLELGLLAVALSSIWMVFVLFIRIGVARWLGARWAYYLWLVPLLGLLAMAIPTQPVQRILDVPGIEVPVVNSVIETASEVFGFVDKPIETIPAQVSSNSRYTTLELLLITWLLGALLSLLYFSIRSFRYSAKMRRSSWALNGQQEALVRTRCAGLANKPSATIRLVSSNRGPAVAGLIRPVLLLPVDFFHRYSAQQQVLMLEHEYQHLRRHDLIALLFARIYRCLFWFNPLVYIAERYLQLDQELSCDEKVLATKKQSIRRVYGETLLLSAHTPFPYAQVSYSPSFGQIKQRTYMLRYYKQHILGRLLGAFLLLVSVGTSVTYGVLGVLDLEPDLEIREELRQPMTEAIKGLETNTFDDHALSAMLAKLERLETAFPQRPLSDNELAQLNSLLALGYYKLGEYDHSLTLYKKVVSLTDEVPENQSQALNSIAEIQFAQENYVETIKALVQSVDASLVSPSAESWALRSRAFVRLQQWDQGLRYINFAIKQTQADGKVPQENWLLSQTALKWKLGDLAGAARSLEMSIEFFPETTYEHTLSTLNELVQEVWEPPLAGQALAQL